MDIFEKFLADCNDDTIALIDSSYKNLMQKEKRRTIEEKEVNTALATYGDALLKFLLCEILLDEEAEYLTEKKKEYESDKVLVEQIAKRYQLIPKIKKNEGDSNLPKDYDYGDKPNEKNSHKYIATAVEACLGEMYYRKKYNLEEMKELIKEWKKYIDRHTSKQNS